MYIGTAVRLGYFLGIDRTAFKADTQKDHPLFVRNKLAWVGQYETPHYVDYLTRCSLLCLRPLSCRKIGQRLLGSWSRYGRSSWHLNSTGKLTASFLGPLSGLRAPDFLSLQPLSANDDNWAAIFQANLELTQMFSNVHDILYSSKGHGWKDMLEGRYAKYLVSIIYTSNIEMANSAKDDFRTSIRTWNDNWGTLICEKPIDASLNSCTCGL